MRIKQPWPLVGAAGGVRGPTTTKVHPRFQSPEDEESMKFPGAFAINNPLAPAIFSR